MLCFFIYMCLNIYPDLVNEAVIRKGVEHSLADSPMLYYTTILKRATFALLALYMALWGITSKKQKD